MNKDKKICLNIEICGKNSKDYSLAYSQNFGLVMLFEKPLCFEDTG